MDRILLLLAVTQRLLDCRTGLLAVHVDLVEEWFREPTLKNPCLPANTSKASLSDNRSVVFCTKNAVMYGDTSSDTSELILKYDRAVFLPQRIQHLYTY